MTLEEKARSFIDSYHKFESFQDIRNHGPFSHGTQGISKERIEEQYGGTIQNIIHDLGTLLEKSHLLQDTFSYDSYNSQIIEYMAKETEIDLN